MSFCRMSVPRVAPRKTNRKIYINHKKLPQCSYVFGIHKSSMSDQKGKKGSNREKQASAFWLIELYHYCSFYSMMKIKYSFWIPFSVFAQSEMRSFALAIMQRIENETELTRKLSFYRIRQKTLRSNLTRRKFSLSLLCHHLTVLVCLCSMFVSASRRCSTHVRTNRFNSTLSITLPATYVTRDDSWRHRREP